MNELVLSEMEWETTLLGRRIGRVEWRATAPVDPEVLDRVGREAVAGGFSLLLARVIGDRFPVIRALEAIDFRLADIGVTLERDAKPPTEPAPPDGVALRSASLEDLAGLEELGSTLFTKSFYYTSNGFSREEADRLHRAWIGNCVRGQRADLVVVAESGGALAGFVTCRFADSAVGVIDLFGVSEACRGRGIGGMLVHTVLKVFAERRISLARVRTQIGNLAAVNLYCRAGFHLTQTDATLIKPLASAYSADLVGQVVDRRRGLQG